MAILQPASAHINLITIAALDILGACLLIVDHPFEEIAAYFEKAIRVSVVPSRASTSCGEILRADVAGPARLCKS
jgi:hypothetical protein